VGIVAGDADSTGLRIATDLARVLDNGNELRIIPMAGKGSLQNITDLLTLKAVDIAIVQSDVLTRFAKISRQPAILSRMQYIAKLYSEEFHVLSRMQFLCLQDLTGRRVSFGPKDSGMAITAEAVFQANNIAVDPLYLDHDEAIERLKRGELDALIYVGGKPSRAFEKITHKDKVHFLDVEYLQGLQATYLPSIITAEDYPNLVTPNETVGTIGVPAVMTVHAWPPQSERFRVVSRFTERFFASIDRLKSGSYNAKWREVNIRAPLKGWQRYQPAEHWLMTNAENKTQAAAAPAVQQLKTMLQKFVESQRGSSAGQEELFNQFVRWYQQQNTQPPQPPHQ
jgi:TRAP transporter TAXI family solute receptor